MTTTLQSGVNKGIQAPDFGAGGIFGGGQVYGGQAQTLQLFDETGVNPLPAGILVTITQETDGSIVGQGWTTPGGYCIVAVPPNVPCSASFGESFQAPDATVSFTADGASQVYQLTVAPYRSPSLSANGYTTLQIAKFVRGWLGDSAKIKGGAAYAIAYALAAGLASFDNQTQTNIQAARLQSCVGTQIDSWSYDMVGPTFGRYPQESDQLFIARNVLMVARPRCTINAIQALVVAFYASIMAGWNVTGSEALGYDTAGSLDTSGGYNTPPAQQIPKQPPPVYVWDGMTEPQLAAQYNIVPPQFVIQIGLISQNLQEQLAYDVAGGLDTQGGISNNAAQSSTPTPSSTAPDPRLGTIINLIAKAAGTTPLYLVGQL